MARVQPCRERQAGNIRYEFDFEYVIVGLQRSKLGVVTAYIRVQPGYRTLLSFGSLLVAFNQLIKVDRC